MLFGFVLDLVVKRGSLTVIDADGKSHSFGDGTGKPVTVRLHDKSLHNRLAMHPHLYLGEAYMDGTLTIEDGTLYDFIDTLTANIGRGWGTGLAAVIGRLRRLMRRIEQYNPVGKAQKNVAHHYDLDRRLYDLFLDEDRQYSCAYFQKPGMTLEDAQLAKKRHIAAKLLLAPEHKVLDIGSGWGGLGLYLNRVSGAHVTGVTLSEEQWTLSRERAAAAGVTEQVDFRLQDYRELDTKFDRIVSVGMFEHVGIGHYKEFFAKVNDLLADDGAMLLHTIGRSDGPGATNPWIAKYIFPGGYIPALSEIARAAEDSGFFISDMEALRLHYADTLRAWRRRFMANWEKAAEIYDERFCRMWEFYLVGAETSFRNEGMVVFQLQLCKNVDALPLIRDYMIDDERSFERRERSVEDRAAS